MAQILYRDGVAAPRVHVRTPRCEGSQMGEDSPADSDRGDHDYRDWTALPALLSFGGVEGQREQDCYAADGDDENDRGFHGGRQIGEGRVHPEKEEVGFGDGVNDGWVRLPGGSIRAEDACADSDSGENGA